MPKTRAPYPAEFQGQMVALMRAGRSVESLVREYEPCAATVHEWVGQAVSGDGDDVSGPTSEGLEELCQLRREAKQLRQERDILSMGRSWTTPLVRAHWTPPGLHQKT